MPNYRRARIPGATCFFTVALLDRRRSLLTDHVGALRDALIATRERRPFELLAVCVLPDHLHCVWRLPQGDADNATRWSQIKGLFSRDLPRTEPRCAVRAGKRERGIWQQRFWERVLVDERDVQVHVDYVHWNPVKHGYVEHVLDWPYSSASRILGVEGSPVRGGDETAGQGPPYGR